jgi:hypothetical protein
MEPRFRGSTSSVEAPCGSSTGFTPGAAVLQTVWQGSAWGRSRGSFWSPTKQGLKLAFFSFDLSDQGSADRSF